MGEKVYATVIPRNVRIPKRRAMASGAGLRSQMSGQPGLQSKLAGRTDPARASAGGSVNAKTTDDHRPRGLGRGLSALIGDESGPTRGEVAASKSARTLPVAFLKPNRFQPRKSFAPEDLNDLTDSIRGEGCAAADPGDGQ